MQELYQNNLPLIKKLIRPYVAYECEADLLQESFFGLWAAVEHYETSKNVRFMTYAAFWIRQAIQRYMERYSSVLRIPSPMRRKMAGYKKAVEQIEQECGGQATDAEVAAIIQQPVEAIGELKALSRGITSLDTALPGIDNDLTLADTLKADLSVEDGVIDKLYAEHSESELWGIVERYTADRENMVIRDIFINNKTMAQVAREQGVSIDRIRQIREKGLCRLRTGKAKRELLEKFGIIEPTMYRGSWNNFKEYGASIVEHAAIRRMDARERYKRHLKEVDVERKRRTMQDEEIDTAQSYLERNAWTVAPDR